MRRISLNSRRFAVFNRNEHTAGVGAIVRARGMNHLLHTIIIEPAFNLSLTVMPSLTVTLDYALAILPPTVMVSGA